MPEYWRATPTEWVPCFGEAHLVHDPGGGGAQGLGEGLPQPCADRLHRPRALPHHLLEGLDVPIGEAPGQGLDGLPLPVEEESPDVDGRPVAPVAAAQRGQDLGYELFEAGAAALHLFGIHGAKAYALQSPMSR